MDPRRELAAPVDELRGVDPLARARRAMEAGELAEQREAQERAEPDHARFESVLVQHEAVARSEVAAFGYTRAEVAAHQQEQEQVRAAKVSEHLAELAKLDPSRFGAAVPGVSRMSVAMPDGGEVVISADPAAPRPLDPRAALAEHQRGQAEWDSGPVLAQRIRALESEQTGRAGRDRMHSPPRHRPWWGSRPARPVSPVPVTSSAGGSVRSISRTGDLYPPEAGVPGPLVGPGDW